MIEKYCLNLKKTELRWKRLKNYFELTFIGQNRYLN